MSSGPTAPAPSGPVSPILGRPSGASSQQSRLRSSGDARSAAYRADGGDGAGWSVRAASVAGVRHRLAGLGPEDSYAWRVVAADPDPQGDPGADAGRPRATMILAVADGVGSVAGSAVASAAAVDAVCTALVRGEAKGNSEVEVDGDGGARVRSVPDGVGWRQAFAAADAAVAAVGGATTLVVAVIGPDGDGAVARLGDSTAMVLSGCGWSELWPADGPEADSVPVATAALPVAVATVPAIEVTPVLLGSDEVLVLMTDGIANPLRDGPTTVAPALAEALRGLPSPLGLAVVADFSRQGCFDDRTIVGLWPGPDDPGGR
jgi:serine/threonine protein phosphatase PrpC